MSEASQQHIHKLLTEAQHKYVYFLLAAAASGIALALNRTAGTPLSRGHWVLGLAILSWGISFFCGCSHLDYFITVIYANAEYLKVRAGQEPEVGRNPQLIDAASSGIMSAVNSNIQKASKFASWQFKFLIWGALFYIGWHVQEMVLAATQVSPP